MKRYVVGIVLVAMWLSSVGFGPSAVQEYAKAMEFAKTKQDYFAFMHYNELVRNYPTSGYRKPALFAIGEYYFSISSLQEAAAIFRTYLDDYPDSQEGLYVLAYLLRIAKKNNDIISVETLEKQIIELQQVSFVFREKKEITYRSPLNQNYKAVIHIDKIEFYLEGKLFAKVSY
jgi:tetratricopeptide (TPR) repeat protein